MKITRVKIISYKNLHNFEWNNKFDNMVNIFAGENGAGKSNFFEAILNILLHITTKDKHINPFYYEFEYEMDSKKYKISYNGEFKVIVDDKVVKEPISTPDNVIVYYSGHNHSINSILKDYDRSYNEQLKNRELMGKVFYFINETYKQIMLMLLLLKPEEDELKKVIMEKFQIESLGDEVKLIVKRPNYAKQNGYTIDPFEESTKYWKVQGILKNFFDKLDNIKRKETSVLRDEGYFLRTGYDDEYILYFEVNSFISFAVEVGLFDLFTYFDSMKNMGMLGEISMDIHLKKGVSSTTNQFSDGQFQSLYILAVSALFNNLNCITILDEPDAFLHPSWQKAFFKQINQIRELTTIQNHILMTSHSAITLVDYDNRKVNYFEVSDGEVKCFELPKSVTIKKMSSDFIKYSEEEQLLSVLNRIGLEKKNILLTEGPTDAKIIQVAWSKLYDDEIPFLPISAFDCAHVYKLLSDDRVFKELENQKLFGLFDFDNAFNNWNGLKGVVIETDPMKGLVKKIGSDDIYALMIPIPDSIIKKQVIKNEATMEHFGDNSLCEIEHLFYGFPEVNFFFKEEEHVGGGKLIKIKNDSKKAEFADKVVPTLDKSCFENFRSLFEFIITI